jgi:phosphoribosyl 1,2-cyclic phosphodiesterase
VTQITFLGTGAAISASNHKFSCVFNKRLLIDTGADPTVELRRAGLDPAQIEDVFLSHLHGDHFFGIAFLITEAIGAAASIDTLLGLAYPVTSPSVFTSKARLEVHEINDGDTVECREMKVNVIRASHGRMNAFSFLVTDADGTRVFAGCDTELRESVIAGINQADCCILNLPSKESSIPAHASLQDVLKARAENQIPILWTFACHRAGWDDTSASNMIIPQDGDVFEVEHRCVPRELRKI